MSGRFVSEEDVVVVHADWWGDDETVTLTRFTYGQQQALVADLLRAQENADRGEMVRSMNLKALQLGIVSWTLKAADGTQAALSPFWIAQLSARDGEFIKGELDRINGRRVRDDQATF